MTLIRIVRNDAGNCVNFIGTTNPAYWNACLSAEVDSSATDRINIINDIRTQQESETVYEFFNIPYTDFEDADGNTFASAQAAADYITEKANVATNTGQFTLSASDTLDFSLDDTRTTILFDNGDSYAVHSIRAVANDSGNINILEHTGSVILFADLRAPNATIGGDAVSATVADAVNELNAFFQQTGGSLGDAPTITSATSIPLTQGDTLNYTLVATNGVGYEWADIPTGVTTVDGNVRKLVGGSELAVGTYTMTATVVNYFGTVSQTIQLVVSAPPFSNTKSVNFLNQDYLGANASLLDPILGRSSNGAGSGDAWSISLWYKGSTSNSAQTIIYFGDNDTANGGNIQLMQVDSVGNKLLRLRYGTSSNRLQLQTSAGTITPGTWQHILITYDGGSTGSSSADINTYYSKFGIFIDGSSQTTTNSHLNYGYTGSVDPDNFRIGRYAAGNYMRGGARVDECAIWGSDQSANISDIYNSGSTFDLDTLTTSPDHWWRMGDGDTYPVIQDNVGTAHFVMYNMTAADIVTDAP